MVALNMMDEAARKGIVIDAAKLSKLLGVPVVTTVAAAGRGLTDLLRDRLERRPGRSAPGPDPVCPGRGGRDRLSGRPAGFRILPRNWGCPGASCWSRPWRTTPTSSRRSGAGTPRPCHWVRNSQKILAQSHGRPPETVISSERHALSRQYLRAGGGGQARHQTRLAGAPG